MKENKAMITPLGMRLLLANGSFIRGDFHQALLDIAYDAWTEHDESLKYEVTSRGDDRMTTTVFDGTKTEVDKWWAERVAANDPAEIQKMGKYIIRPMRGETHCGYNDMLDNAREKFGEMFWAMTMVGKYNQQVGNGGHIQYYDNGYCDVEKSGCFDKHDPEIPMHREMRHAFREMIIPMCVTEGEREIALNAHAIMKRFHVVIDENEIVTDTCANCFGSGEKDCPECDGEGLTGEGDGEKDCPECDGNGYVECYYCDGKGTCEGDNDNKGCVCNSDMLDKLDSEWYEQNDAFMTLMNIVALREISVFCDYAGEINLAARVFEDELKQLMDDCDRVMPCSEVLGFKYKFGEHGVCCVDELIADNLRYNCIEPVRIDGEVMGYRESLVNVTRNKLEDTIREMKPGNELNYWHDIADRFDVADENDCPRLDIVKEYDRILESKVKHGYLEPVMGRNDEDDEDSECVVGYRKLEKK